MLKETMSGNLIVLSLAAVCICGCGTASTAKESWMYIGSDEKLKSPPRISADNAFSEVWHQRFRENMQAWQKQRHEALEITKDVCARETGDGRIPGSWLGHGTAFMACMKAQGWSCCLGNPP